MSSPCTYGLSMTLILAYASIYLGYEVLVKKLNVYALLFVVAVIPVVGFAPAGLSSLTIYNKIPGEDIHLRTNGIRFKGFYYLTA
jgi:hypothetical protein